MIDYLQVTLFISGAVLMVTLAALVFVLFWWRALDWADGGATLPRRVGRYLSVIAGMCTTVGALTAGVIVFLGLFVE